MCRRRSAEKKAYKKSTLFFRLVTRIWAWNERIRLQPWHIIVKHAHLLLLLIRSFIALSIWGSHDIRLCDSSSSSSNSTNVHTAHTIMALFCAHIREHNSRLNDAYTAYSSFRRWVCDITVRVVVFACVRLKQRMVECEYYHPLVWMR